MIESIYDSSAFVLPAIAVHRFHKAYGKTVAVSDLSFEVKPGQIFGLVGPNGAGKTTTLRAISAILPLTKGDILVARENVAANPVKVKKSLAYVPDDPQLFSDLTVWEHLAFTAAAYEVAEAERYALKLLESFELNEKRHTLARDLSRGMRQKLAICCAYLRDPEVLLFDEPLTGLDPRGIRTLKQSIRDRAAAGAAIIISSHLLGIVEDMCTQLLILDRGRPRFLGTMEELRSKFQSHEPTADLERIFFLATEDAVAARSDTEPDVAQQPVPLPH